MSRRAIRYRWNPKTQKMEKVGVSKLRPKIFWDGPRVYENLGEVYVKSQQHKHELMEEQGVEEK